MKPFSAQMNSLFQLWDKLAAYPAGELDGALRFLMKWISHAIDADNVVWIGAVRVLSADDARKDPFLGWRLRGRRPLRNDPAPYRKQLASYYFSEHYGKLTPTYYQRSHEEQKDAHVGMTGRAAVAGAGKFRIHRLRDGWIDFRAFRKTLHYRFYYEEPGIIDRIWIGFPINGNSESFFLIDRFQNKNKNRRHFSQAEAVLAGAAVRGIPEFHRRLFLNIGLLVGDKPLSPMEQQVLQGLLGGRTEKEIATTTGQKVTTTHTYVTNLYAKFGVKSRAALMALWLGSK